MSQDAPVRKTEQRCLVRSVSAGRFPRPSARDLEPRRALRPAAARLTDPQNRKLAFVPGRTSQIASRMRLRVYSSRRRWHHPRHRQADTNNLAPRIGIAWDREGRRQNVGPRRGRNFLRQHHRQRVEHHGGQPALHAPTVHSYREDAVRSVSATSPAASGRSRSTTIRPTPSSRIRPRSSGRRSTSSGPKPTR